MFLKMRKEIIYACFLSSIFHGCFAGEEDHKYDHGDIVNLYVNKIGPYHNPLETYGYYSLPFCKPDSGIPTAKRGAGLGEILEGHELRNSGMVLKFGENSEKRLVCSMQLTKDDADHFKTAVLQNYWFNMYIDDLPIWGMVGEIEDLGGPPGGGPDVHSPPAVAVAPPASSGKGPAPNQKVSIYTHRIFEIYTNGDRIVKVNLISDGLDEVITGRVISFTFTVRWLHSDLAFEDRFDRYLDYTFFEHQIHWFSIFNSFMMVIFLCGLVALILIRTLKNDFAKYTRTDDELELMENFQGGSNGGMGGGGGANGPMADDSGWKQVHGDVFRAPRHLMAFSALLGSGWQLISLVGLAVLYAMAGPLHGDVYEERGELAMTVVACYALTSFVAGYTSGSFYRQYFPTPRSEQSSKWQQAMLLTFALVPAVLGSVILSLNWVAVYYDTLNTIPFMVIVQMACIWLFVSLPLIVVGTMVGRHWGGGRNTFPCRVNSIPRQIPPGPWYARPAVVIPMTGLLPFGSIFIEMYFIFTSFWNYKFYYVYGFMLLVYAILIVVSICTTIVATYFVLNAENYHWQWVSFFSSGSTAAYVFLYSIYYFAYKTQMTGFFQVVFYFGYMALFSFLLFILCGTLGVAGSTIFVKQIYRNIKID